MIVINDTLGTYGGSITLIQRMCTWAVENDKEIKIYCNDTSNKDIVQKLNQINVKIECFNTNDSIQIKKHLLEDVKGGDLRIINFVLNNFMSIECVKKKEKIDFINLIYSIHPATFFKGTGVSNSLLKNAIIRHYSNIIQRINLNEAMIFMDQDNVRSTERFYDIKLKKEPQIQALPMSFLPLNEDVLKNKLKKSYERKIIFTSCRADFPFKGYLFGLIDDFAELTKKYKDIKLCIVCSGDKKDVIRVKEKILEKSSEIQSMIELHNWMKYEDLQNKIALSYLYIGMGTGVLDATVKYVPAIAVKYNTYDNIASCILCDRPDFLVADDTNCTRAIKFMDELLKLDWDTYQNISKKCFDEAKKTYDIEGFFEKMQTIPHRMSNLKTIDVIVHKINTFLNSLKKQKHYDVNNIQYEEGD